MTTVTVSSCTSLQKPGTENTAQDSSTGTSSLPVRLQLPAPQTQIAKADPFFTQKTISRILKHFKWTQTAQVRSLLPTCLSPLPFVMLTSFSMPPVSARALAFSMFLLVTSCRAQQMAATVSSDRMLGPLPPGSRLTRSRIAYLPGNTHPLTRSKPHFCPSGWKLQDSAQNCSWRQQEAAQYQNLPKILVLHRVKRDHVSIFVFFFPFSLEA